MQNHAPHVTLKKQIEETILSFSTIFLPLELQRLIITTIIQKRLLSIINDGLLGKMFRIDQELELIKPLLTGENNKIYSYPPHQEILKAILLPHFDILFDDIFSGKNNKLQERSTLYFNYLATFIKEELQLHHDSMKAECEHMTFLDAKKILAYVQITDDIDLLDGKVVVTAVNKMQEQFLNNNNKDVCGLLFHIIQMMNFAEDYGSFSENLDPILSVGYIDRPGVREAIGSFVTNLSGSQNAKIFFLSAPLTDKGCTFTHARFYKTDLSGINFIERGVNFENCDFTGANLSGTSFEFSGNINLTDVTRDVNTQITEKKPASVSNSSMFSSANDQQDNSSNNSSNPKPF